MLSYAEARNQVRRQQGSQAARELKFRRGSSMSVTRRGGWTAHRPAGRLLPLLALIGSAGAVWAEPRAVVDSQSIVRSLRPAGPATRGLTVAARPEPGAGHKITLDIRSANDSDRLTEAAHAQLAELGAALESPELARARFLIAGHTSASGAPAHNRRLSEARARSVRGYLLQRFHIAPQRLE